MPELPEVETVRRGLAPRLDGAVILDVERRRSDLRFPFPCRFEQRLRGRRAGCLTRRAKYLLLPLAGGETLLMHLGMSGRFRIEDACAPARAHDHVVFSLEGCQIIFNDARRFGFMELWPDIGTCPRLHGLAPEPLSAAFDAAFLAERMQGRRSSVKQTLLDQSVCAGAGNIYVSEALYDAGIHPERAAGTLPARDIERLVDALKAVFDRAIAAGGTSLRDHGRPDGSLGYFQNRLSVYGRAGRRCPACGTLIERIVQGGRSSFFCPNCQKFCSSGA